MASIKGRFGMPGMRQECALRCRSGKSGVRMSSELSVMEFGETTKAGNLQIGFPVSPPYQSLSISFYSYPYLCMFIHLFLYMYPYMFPYLSIVIHISGLWTGFSYAGHSCTIWDGCCGPCGIIIVPAVAIVCAPAVVGSKS